MTESYLPPAIVLPPLVGALLVTAFALHRARWARWVVILATTLSLLAAATALWHCAHGRPLDYQFGGWAAPYGIVYHVDGLGALMAVLIAGISLAVLVYAGPSATAEVSGEEPSFFATAGLLIAALLGMVVTGDLFNLYVFLEIASIAAYSLIAAGGGAASLASFRYLLIGTVGATFYLLGLAYLYALTGTLNMADMAARLPAVEAPAAVLVALAFIITGFALKAALFPMHGWLPDAYTYAPSAATALIAALMTKVNAFALIRVLYGVLWPTVGTFSLQLTPLLGWLAAAGILFGGVMAVAQTDLKRLLAYSSISHLGYVMLGLALGNRAGLTGAMLEIIAHAMSKGCLFLIAGAVAYRCGIRSVTELHRVGRQLPLSMAALVVAALSMIGVPPTAGFFSKWYLILGSLAAGHYGFVIVLLLSSLLGVWYFFRLIETIYFARPGEHTETHSTTGPELPRAMLAPIVVLATAIVVVGMLSDTLVGAVVKDEIAVLVNPGMTALSVAPDLGSVHGSH